MIRTTKPSAHSRDAGATFIEILVSVVLLGTAGVAVLAAMSAALVGARVSDEVASSQADLAEAVDYMTDTDPEHIAYRSCDAMSTAALILAYEGDLDARFGVGVMDVVDVRFWNGPAGVFTGTCRAGVGDRLQEIELRTADPDSQRSATAVKRPADVPTLDIVAAPPLPPYSGGSGQATVSLTPGINGP